jgi:shikimate O-hydroxycinnamoyltransferase
MEVVQKVQIMETEMITPCEETPKHTIWLSNLDLLVARAHTPTVYFYRPSPAAINGDDSFFSPAALKASLSKTLVSFYPMAGRLGASDDGRLEIRCTGEGVLFVVARSDSSLNDLGDFAPSQKLRELLSIQLCINHVYFLPYMHK